METQNMGIPGEYREYHPLVLQGELEVGSALFRFHMSKKAAAAGARRRHFLFYVRLAGRSRSPGFPAIGSRIRRPAGEYAAHAER